MYVVVCILTSSRRTPLSLSLVPSTGWLLAGRTTRASVCAMACFARGVDGRVTWSGCVVQFHPSSLDCLLCLWWKIACVVVLRAEPLSSQEQILLSFINLTMFRSVAFLFFNLVVAALGQSTFIEPANELYPVNWDEVSDTVTITNLPASCKCVDRPQPVTGTSATC